MWSLSSEFALLICICIYIYIYIYTCGVFYVLISILTHSRSTECCQKRSKTYSDLLNICLARGQVCRGPVFYRCTTCLHLRRRPGRRSSLVWRLKKMLRSKSSYGKFSKFHVRFRGPDPSNLKFETVRTNKQHFLFLGFETLKLNICDLKLRKLAVMPIRFPVSWF